MKLNKIANNVRNLDIGLSDNKTEDIKQKQQIIAILKAKHGYTKDSDASAKKRERWAKIRDLAGNDPKKIIALQGQLYTDDEKVSESLSRQGYSALYEQYGKDERYKEFFSKLKIEGNDIIIDHKKFALLTAEHDGKDIFSGDFEKNGQKGIPGLTYMTGKAEMEQAKKQKKKLFKTGEEVGAFINQFP